MAGLPSRAFLRASLALWRRRETARKRLHAKAQQELDEARARDEHPRQMLVDRRDLRSRQLTEARDMIDRREHQLATKDAGTVRRPFERVKTSVCNQSSRGGVKPKLIVLHDTEGANITGVRDLQGLAGWFDNPAAQASSHVAVDAEGISARFVSDAAKAWHCAAFNSVSLGIEQVGFASQKTWPDAQLRKTAQYVAYWAKRYGIPITHSTGAGVCMHSDLGTAGGGHHDPGGGFPFDRVLDLARDYKTNGW